MVGLLNRQKRTLIFCTYSLQCKVTSRIHHELKVDLVAVNICCLVC